MANFSATLSSLPTDRRIWVTCKVALLHINMVCINFRTCITSINHQSRILIRQHYFLLPHYFIRQYHDLLQLVLSTDKVRHYMTPASVQTSQRLEDRYRFFVPLALTGARALKPYDRSARFRTPLSTRMPGFSGEHMKI